MSSPAVLALAAPAEVPAAALARIDVTGAALNAEVQSYRAGVYAPLADLLSRIAAAVSVPLSAAVADTASDTDIAAVVNAERAVRAARAIFDESARRETWHARASAMRLAHLARILWADVALTRREYAYGYTVPNIESVLRRAPIRIYSAAEPALAMLALDPLAYGPGWNLTELSGLLVRWVMVA